MSKNWIFGDFLKILTLSSFFSNEKMTLIFSFEKKLEKVKIFKKSPKLQFLPDFHKLWTKMCGRPRALKKTKKKFLGGPKIGKIGPIFKICG